MHCILRRFGATEPDGHMGHGEGDLVHEVEVQLFYGVTSLVVAGVAVGVGIKKELGDRDCGKVRIPKDGMVTPSLALAARRECQSLIRDGRVQGVRHEAVIGVLAIDQRQHAIVVLVVAGHLDLNQSDQGVGFILLAKLLNVGLRPVVSPFFEIKAHKSHRLFGVAAGHGCRNAQAHDDARTVVICSGDPLNGIIVTRDDQNPVARTFALGHKVDSVTEVLHL